MEASLMARVHTCFWLEPTDRQKRYLRRFTFSSNVECPNQVGGHESSVRIDDGLQIYVHPDDEPLRTYFGAPPVSDFAGDPRWPRQCDACGYIFQDSDEWQVNGDQLFMSTCGLGEMTNKEAPAGAMWDCTSWTSDRWRGPDGRCLAVKLPPGGPHDWWMIDGPASKKGDEPPSFWTRVGSTLPDISVTPSILSNKYHGFLTNGQLLEC